jgi:pimeloyl-ACP methyl ester carboxylesterase
MSSFTYSTVNGIGAWRGGTGQPLLFLHAAGTGADAIRRLAEPFAASRNVIVPNFPGYGGVPSDPAADPIAERVAYVKALLQEHDQAVDIVGHSMGAFMALQAARASAVHIGKLIAIEPVAFGAIATGDPIDEAALEVDQAANRSLVEAFDRGDHEAGIASFISLWNGTPWPEIPPPVRQALLAMGPLLRRDADAVSTDRTPASAYAHLGPRLCLVVGEHSPAPAQRICLRIHQAAEGSRLAQIADVGHMGPVQQPKRYLPILTEFLESEATGHA